MNKAKDIINGMRGFIGTTRYHKFNPNIVTHVLTDGAKYIADKANAYWLMDEISLGHKKAVGVMGPESWFQVWKLSADKAGKVILTLGDGNNNVIYSKDVIADFPLDSIELFCVEGDGVMVIMLPSEY